MYIIVGGLFTDEIYMQPFIKQLQTTKNDNVFFCMLNHSSKEHITFENQCDMVFDLILYKILMRHDIKDKSNINLIGYSLGCTILLRVITLLWNVLEIKVNNITFVNPCNFFCDICFDKSFTYSNFKHNVSLISDKNVPYQYSIKHNIQFVNLLSTCLNWIPLFRQLFVWLYNLTVAKRLEEPECLIEFITKQNSNIINELIKSNLAEKNVYRLIDNLPMNLKKIKIISGKQDRYNSYGKLLSEYRNDLFTLCEVDGMHHILHPNYVSMQNMCVCLCLFK